MNTRTAFAARLGSLVSVAILLLFLFGSIGGDLPKRDEALGLLLFPTGVVIGMVVGWRKEKLGGVITLACLALFYGWHWLVSSRFPSGPYFLLLSFPGLLFLISGLFSRSVEVGDNP